MFMELIFVLSPNTGKYGHEKTPYLDTFHAVVTKFFRRPRLYWGADDM